MGSKRKDQNRILKYQQTEKQFNEGIEKDGFGKNILLLVEGETEVVYFEKLKQNSWLQNSLAGVKIERLGDLGTMMKYLRDNEAVKDKYKNIWIVADNDKQNAFILEKKSEPFFKQLTDTQIPIAVRIKLEASYSSDSHAYFLSIHDYLRWLKSAIGSDDTIEYWDRIQHFTPIKECQLGVFDENYIILPHGKIKLAYSCIAFEFWLILHFEQCSKPFLWVGKEKDAEIDVVTFLKTLRPDYEKGIEKPCNSYSCLYDDFNKSIATRDDDWRILIRIFTAYKNAVWLRNEMQPILTRQSGKWYEVNPYVLGIDMLIAELLNIKHSGESFDYFGLTIQFSVNDGNAFVLNHHHKSFFEIKNKTGTSFFPNIETTFEFPNPNNAPAVFQYSIPQSIDDRLVLVFKDPRSKSKSSQLFILLN